MNKFNRAEIIDRAFIDFVKQWRGSRLHGTTATQALLHSPVSSASRLTGHDAIELLESQMQARHLDLVARMLRARDAAFYTIGSAGHEGNAVVGRLLRLTDPAFLHYRSAAFMMERARKVPGIDIVYDTILSQAASSDDPIAGGRHKVWGSKPLYVLPQTSTIASHLPKAVGTAISLWRAHKMGVPSEFPADSVVLCSFGDASTNHSTALGALNTAGWASYQQIPVPIVFLCEDNGIGISVRTPLGYLERMYGSTPGLEYFRADGTNLAEAYEVAAKAIDFCRSKRRPVFLHFKMVRMLGHAGSDFEFDYRTMEEIEATEADDPLLKSARMLLDMGLRTKDRILERYEEIRNECLQKAERAITRPRLTTAVEVMKPLAPYSPERVRQEATRTDWQDRRLRTFERQANLPENSGPRHLASQLNQTLFDLMSKYPEAIVFGEDIAKKGGVYHVTTGLQKKFNPRRVFNTLLDEQSILGLAQGAGTAGLLPFAEIQYLAYFHNACDQLRSEACSLQFFSNDQFRNPMVVRIAALAYQKGFGGHFHNDNSIAALRDIPGLVIACPSRADDAAAMLRTCAALAKVDGRIVVFLEPIALYMTKDLYEEKDGAWQFEYPPIDSMIELGEGRVYHEDHRDLAIVTYGNGVYFSLRVAKQLEQEGIGARVLDLRWLSHYDSDWVLQHVVDCGRALVVDEGRRTGGMSESIFTAIVEKAPQVIPMARVVGEDTYIPLGPAANSVLPSEERILEAARALTREKRGLPSS